MQIARKLSPSYKAQPAKPKVSSESRTRLERPEESSRRVLRASECRVISEHSPRELQDNPSNIQKHVFGLVHRLENRLVHRVTSLVSCDSRATCSQKSRENQCENPSKIRPRRGSGAPKRDPKSVPGPPRYSPWRPGGSQRRLGSVLGASRARPGSARQVPKGVPGRRKERPGALRSAPRRPKSTPSRARKRKN